MRQPRLMPNMRGPGRLIRNRESARVFVKPPCFPRHVEGTRFCGIGSDEGYVTFGFYTGYSIRRMPAPRSVPTPLALAVTARTGVRYVPYVRRHLRRAHAMLNPPLRELSLAFVGDAHMSRLHEQFMGIAGPTDVLTFPLEEDARGRATAGEVVVCVPEARRRAQAHGVAVERELLLYALHGLLHLSGYDDRTARDFRRMHRTEDMILTQLGVGPVVAPPRGAGASPAPQSDGKTRARRPRHARGTHARGAGARR